MTSIVDYTIPSEPKEKVNVIKWSSSTDENSVTNNNDNVKNVMHDEHDYIYAFVLNYCKKNPDKWLIDAADEYFFTLPEYEE